VNLHGIVAPIIGSVNPNIPAQFLPNVGWTIQPSGKRVPQYADCLTVVAQVQAMSWRDLMQIDGLNLNGTKVAIYLYGKAAATVRVNFNGGDLITILSGNWAGVYLTHVVLEQWPDWVKVACTLQNQPVAGSQTPGPALGNNPP
jgi:hypothetical protein